MGLVAAVAGPYTAAYNPLSTGSGGGDGSTSIGKVDRGYEIRVQVAKEAVRGDLYGDTVLDNVYRGANVFMSLTGIEYAAGLVNVFTVYSGDPTGGAGSSAGTIGQLGLVGVMDSASGFTGAMVLTAVSGTTAATAPATVTSSESIITEDSLSLLYSTQYRRVPITLQLLPYLNSVNVWWTQT